MATCSSCGHGVEPDASFCDQCGAAAVTSDVVQIAETHDAFRKTVTVFFCDLVGSTTLGERLDAESARDIMGRYHAMVQQVIEAHGGSVDKFIGDGVMAMFGVPEVAADDAERAVATGLELQRGFVAFAELISDRYDVDVGLRVGINSGEVVIGDADSDVVGDALNTAARLEGACTPGEVLVGVDTWRLTRSVIRYEPFGVLDLRGKSETVRTFRAVDEIVAVDDSTTPFVGRRTELTRLREVFDDAVSQRTAKLVTVIGSPGVGKTRLARELCRGARDEMTFIDLRCERAGATTFGPIADLLRLVCDIDDALNDEATIAELTRLVAGLDDADRVATLLGGFVGAAPVRSTEELFFAVRRLIESLGRRAPVLMVVDDIQWAEPMFLDLLEHLAEWVYDSPALVLALARPELREIRPALTEAGRTVAETISLEGLTAQATEELAARLVGADVLPHDLLARLPDSTEGNPLFVRELMKMLVDDGVIVELDGRWELTIDAEAVEVPPTIHGLLSARLERMPVDERRLIELASVVGPDFPLGAVAAISTSGDVGALLPTLERLRRKELIEPIGTYWGDEPLFRFHHVLIRDAAYRRLLKGARADLHVEVGTWFEAAASNLIGEHEVTIAHHFEQAHDYRQQLNILDDETTAIGRRACGLLRSAAIRALERDDVAAAGSLAVRAVARLDSDADELPDLLMLGCEALLASGDVGSARPLLKQLADRAVGDERLAAWTACFDAQLVVLTEPDQLEVAQSAAESVADELASLGDQAGEAKARLVLAGALARLGRIGDCEVQLDLALNAARAADDGRRIAAVLGAAPVAALWGPSPVSRAGGRCLDVIRLLRITTGSPRVEATSTRCQAVLEALRGRFDTARTMLAEARATVEELGLRHGLLETELYSGIVELLANDPVAAEPFLRSAYGGLGRLGIGADAGQAAAHLSRALLLQGRLDEADELAADSEALAGQNPQTSIAAHTARAEILAARGDLTAALRLAEAAVELGAGSDIVIDHGQANVALARVRLAAGDIGGAVRARQAAEALFAQKGATIDLGELALLHLPVEADAPDNEPPQGGNAAVPLGGRNGLDAAAERETFADSVLATGRSIEASAAVKQFATSSYALFARSVTDRDIPKVMAVMDDQLRLVDHRQLGWAVVDSDGFRGRLDSLMEIPGEIAVAFPHIHLVDGLLSLVEMVTVFTRPGGAEHTDRSLLINATSIESGLTLRTEQFHGHELAAASARFEEMCVEARSHRGLWNLASLATNRLCSWRLRGLTDLTATLFADDVIVEDQHGVRSAIDLDDFEVSQRRVLAVRGERLALVEFRPADSGLGPPTNSKHRFAVVELDADSLISRMTYFDFDHEPLRAAANLIDVLWLDSQGVDVPDGAGVQMEMLEAYRSRDVDRLRAVLSDDVRILDHRPLGWSDFDKEGWLDLFIRVPENRAAQVASRVLRITEQGIVVEMSEWNFGAGVDLDETLPGIYIAMTNGAQVTHIEGHSDQDPGAALARFDELVAEQGASTRRPADDLVVEDRRSTTDVATAGGGRSVDELGMNESVLDPAGARETIAERSGRLALSRASVRQRDGGRGRELDCLVVDRLNAVGQVDLEILFDADDYLTAMDELDRLFLDEVDDPTLAWVLRISQHAFRAVSLGDIDLALQINDPACRMVDHRQMGWPELDQGGFAERLRSFHEVGGTARMFLSRIHGIDGQVAFFETLTIVSTPDGAVYDDRNLLVSALKPTNFLVSVQHQYSNDQYADAAQKFEELRVADTAHRFVNAAVWIGVWLQMGIQKSFSYWAGAMLADDLIAEDQHGNSLIAEFADIAGVASAEGVRRLGLDAEHRDVLAIRGERFALVHLHGRRDDNSFHQFVVEEVTGSGQLGRITHFDFDEHSLRAAVDLLDDRWIIVDRLSDAEMSTPVFVAAQTYGRDHERFADCLADDVVIDDRKPLSWPKMGKAEWFELTSRVEELSGVGIVGRIESLSNTGGIVQLSHWNFSDGGDLDEMLPGLYLLVARNGQIVHIESVPDDVELDFAVVRLAELVAEHEQRSGVDGE